MRIKSIHILGFGKFSNFNLNFNKNFTFIWGLNESGKSTIRQFILGVLYGFAKNWKQKVNLYEPHNHSQYGGNLVLEKNGKNYTISRIGRINSILQIYDQYNHKTYHTDKFLYKLLFPFDKESYLDIFSFDQEQLNKIGRLSYKEFSKKILDFSAISANRWLKFSKNLGKEADQKFSLTKISKRPVNLLLKQHKNLQNKLNRMGESLDRFRSVNLKKQNLKKQIILSRRKEKKLANEKKHLNELLYLSDLFKRKKEIINLNKQPRFSSKQIDALTENKKQKIKNLQYAINSLNSVRDNKNEKEDNFLKRPDTPLLKVYKKNKTKIDVLKRSFSDLIIEKDLYERLENEKNILKTRLLKLEKNPKSKFYPYFIIILFLFFISALGGFFTFKIPSHSFIYSVTSLISLIGLIIFSALIFIKKKDKVGLHILKKDLGTYNEYLSQLQSIKKKQEHCLNKIKYFFNFSSPLKDFLPKTNNFQETISRLDILLKKLEQEEKNNNIFLERKKIKKENEINKKKKQNQIKNLQKKLFLKLGLNNFKEFQELDFDKIKKEKIDDQLNNISKILTPEKEQSIVSLGGILNIKKKIQDKNNLLHSLSDDIQEFNSEVNNCDAILMNLVSDDGYQNELQDKSNLETEINNDLFNYFSYKLAAEWINKTLYKISHRRMPVIIKTAERFFYMLTDGKYKNIIMDNENLFVISKDNQRFLIYELSKGTSEQLYISLRLSLAQIVSNDNPLPFLIDDAFVDFDNHRKQIVEHVLYNFSKKFQVIYFSSHIDELINKKDILKLNIT